MIKQFTDKELGQVLIKRNVRAKRTIARRLDGHIQLTIPSYFNDDQIFEVFEKLRSKLIALPSRSSHLFVPHTEFKTSTFNVVVSTRSVTNYYVKLQHDILSIVCPSTTDFSHAGIQGLIRRYVEHAMRLEAKRVLPPKVAHLASIHNFNYSEVKINKSKTRWGSCSSRKSINLSYHCMILPDYLIDFIILHELCHTIEMNHGPNFWSLLDSVTNNRAKELTKQLHRFSTHW